ncbi:MAG: prolyl oligopeptidase family serine peptidase [Planctomycetota bacterium]
MIVLCSALATAKAQTADAAPQGLTYPVTKTVNQVDNLHGVEVADPYRWLEDLDSAETAAWVAAQNKVTFGWLEQIPAREKIRQRMTHLWNFEKYGTPFKEGNRYFFSKNDGLQNQSVLYITEALDADPRVLLDPNQLSADGTVALADLSITEDGRLMAYGLSTAGSDWVEYHVRDIDTGQDLPDHLKWIKFSGAAWTKDGQGFYYSHYDAPAGDELAEINKNQKLYYHRLGTPQSADALVYFRPEQPKWGYGSTVSEDGRYLIISISEGTERKNRVYYQDLQAGDGLTHKLLDDFDAQYGFIGNDGPLFWFFTTQGAPLGRVIAIDINHPRRDTWIELIPQARETLQGVGVINDTFVASYLKDAHSLVRLYDLQGQYLRDLELPGLGSAGGFGGKRTDTETFYNYNSFSVPNRIYRYDMRTGESTLFRQPKVDFDPDAYVTTQIFYRGKDGTRIPMFITHRKDLPLDGNNPTYLYGYGGFDVSLTPRFSISRLILMEMGGVVAIANLRGGGEYGCEWHDAGRLDNKQNVFDDFISAAEWLIANKYTRPEKLAIAGASNGGLLVGACMVQRPELFGACLPEVGVMDMLRFHKFTIGWAWTSDYGSPDDPHDFQVIYKYSPLHNLKPGTCYPATLVTTADHDDRVVPAHSFKFISALQAAQACDHPVMIRIETKAGHGAGKSTAKIIEEISDEWAFLVRVLEMDTSSLEKTSSQPASVKGR